PRRHPAPFPKILPSGHQRHPPNWRKRVGAVHLTQDNRDEQRQSLGGKRGGQGQYLSYIPAAAEPGQSQPADETRGGQRLSSGPRSPDPAIMIIRGGRLNRSYALITHKY